MNSLSLADVMDNAKYLYVINNTKTDISVTVRDDDGISRLIRILRSSVPQDLAEVISPAILKKTASFKRAVSSGYLSVIPEEQARKILSTPHAKVELASIKKKLARIPKELMVSGEVTPLEAISGGMSDPNIRPEIKDIAVGDEPADDKFARLLALNNEQNITTDEATWLLSRLPSSSEYNEIIQWLNSIYVSTRGMK